jgi:hypothetical protein
VKIKTTQETLAFNQIITDLNLKKGILIVHWPTQENRLGNIPNGSIACNSSGKKTQIEALLTQ